MTSSSSLELINVFEGKKKNIFNRENLIIRINGHEMTIHHMTPLVKHNHS